MRGLFLSVIRRRSKKRHSVPMPTSDAFLRKRRLDLHEGDVRRLLDEREDQPGMRLDAARAAVSAERLRPRVALCALARAPADRARGAHSEAKRRLAARQPVADGGENPRPQIERKRFRHVCRPPAPADSLNQLKIAYLFTEKRTGHPANSIGFVPSKDVETAKVVLASLEFDEVPAFLDYALGEAKRTNFDIQTLGGTKQYLASFLALRERKIADRAQQAAQKLKDEDDARQQAYDRYRRSTATHIFAALPKSEQDIINSLAQTSAAKFNGSLQGSMTEFNRVRFTIERHGDQLMTFEQWKSDQIA